MEFRVVVEPQDNLYHAFCPNLHGCHSWGATAEEAMQYIEEALQFYVDNFDETLEIEYEERGKPDLAVN
ncbi:MAG: type II toxin-antitoxin system HicB family antitoxin [Armatimonadetes bacterium]|jgi:predicted RNase H-like HicB family nuclease|nr:type II toxin-antitoxin system HicB family antitoxin [Armatimonadota bacterium]